ncbi:glycosyltransferase [Portibacter marinus]|uniref:glycosyltransferase n=1 Tax=Portibacter marinus TaxID=2898660 RepID=UPI001F3E9D46|nr:glycosyltransferase [Portibacter marinus]
MTDKTLYCVLNWGLGHASRSIPILRDLIKNGHDVSMASDGLPLKMLKEHFPYLPSFELPPYHIHYRYDSIAANLLSQSYKILRAIRKENRMVNALVEKHQFSHIISDSRYGCYNDHCKNVFITHQLKLMHPNAFIQASATKLNLSMVSKFDECWIPDEEGATLSGGMNKDIELDIPKKYIGLQSRFAMIPIPADPKYLSISILSGPEPQRSIFQEQLESQLIHCKGDHIIVSGVQHEVQQTHNLLIYPYASVEQLTLWISESKHIISRSGYSSLMDYKAMGRKAILIPTPGQTEQEYLGRLAGQMGSHTVITQDRMRLAPLLT